MKQFLRKRADWRRYAVAAAGGGLLSLAFPNAGVAGLAWIAPAVILFSALGARGATAFRCGFWGGMVFWLASLSWLLAIPYRWAGVPVAPAIGWLALSAYCSLYMGAWVWWCGRVWPASARVKRNDLEDSTVGKTHFFRGFFALPAWASAREAADRMLDAGAVARMSWAWRCAAGWAGLETLRGWFLSGFPWNFLGASQFRMLPLVQIASVTGILGVSFLIVWTSVSLGLLAVKLWRQPPGAAGTSSTLPGGVGLRWSGGESIWATAGLPLITVVAIAAAGAVQTAQLPAPARELKVALVQPDFPQTLIWNEADDAARFQKMLALSRQALAGEPDILIWPESAAPELSPQNQDAITRLLQGHKSWMILCADTGEPAVDGGVNVYNSSVLLDPEGRVQGIYHKRRLVIFGEYIPLVRWLPFLKSLVPIGSFTPGDAPVTFHTAHPSAAPSVLICFEDMFPQEARAHVLAGADVLINLTNDGWFGDGAEQWQQAASALFRAVENGVPLVRCCNNGITCWIDDRGRLREVLGAPGNVYQPGILTAQISMDANRAPTFYRRHGNWLGWCCLALMAAGIVRRRRTMRGD